MWHKHTRLTAEHVPQCVAGLCICVRGITTLRSQPLQRSHTAHITSVLVCVVFMSQSKMENRSRGSKIMGAGTKMVCLL